MRLWIKSRIIKIFVTGLPERDFSLAKRKCELGQISTRLKETTQHTITLAIVVLNLRKVLCAFFQDFLYCYFALKNWAFIQHPLHRIVAYHWYYDKLLFVLNRIQNYIFFGGQIFNCYNISLQLFFLWASSNCFVMYASTAPLVIFQLFPILNAGISPLLSSLYRVFRPIFNISITSSMSIIEFGSYIIFTLCYYLNSTSFPIKIIFNSFRLIYICIFLCYIPTDYISLNYIILYPAVFTKSLRNLLK